MAPSNTANAIRKRLRRKIDKFLATYPYVEGEAELRIESGAVFYKFLTKDQQKRNELCSLLSKNEFIWDGRDSDPIPTIASTPVPKAAPKAPKEKKSEPATKPTFREGTKRAAVYTLLTRTRGATIEQLVEVTGWSATVSVSECYEIARKIDKKVLHEPKGAYRLIG